MSDDLLLRVEKTLQRLAIDNAQLRAENRRLRKLSVNRGHGRIVTRALDDAAAMLAWRFAGYSISRESCRELGLSERRWEWARALLWAARIHDGQDLTEDDFESAKRAIARKAAAIMESGDLAPLRMRRRRRDISVANPASKVALRPRDGNGTGVGDECRSSERDGVGDNYRQIVALRWRCASQVNRGKGRGATSNNV